jgi:hypothetical protein
MSKKQPNLIGIENELRGASLFFAKAAVKEVTEGPQTAPNEAQDATELSQVLHQPKALSSHQSGKEKTSLPSGNERSNGASFERSIEATLQRTKVRHTFDIFKDQLAALRKIQLEREELFGKRYLLGDLAQEALDLFITKQRNNE